jgi:DNA (cytosine-5)-methyltransferase 1
VRADFLLCGSQFGLRVRRHRAFETSPRLYSLQPPCHHRDLLPFMHKGERAYADALGCTWMTNREAREAIPPAFTAHVGERLLEHLAVKR